MTNNQLTIIYIFRRLSICVIFATSLVGEKNVMFIGGENVAIITDWCAMRYFHVSYAADILFSVRHFT